MRDPGIRIGKKKITGRNALTENDLKGVTAEMNYYISDLHLLHEHCICFDERPFGDLEKMHETMNEL